MVKRYTEHYKIHDIAPKPSTSNRDIHTEPVPLPNNRMVMWELNHHEMAPTPTIPECLIYENIEAAKTIAIENIQEVLTSMPDNSPQLVANMISWMTEQLDSSQVLDLYANTTQDLPARNGLVTEYNNVLSIATRSSVNTSLLDVLLL